MNNEPIHQGQNTGVIEVEIREGDFKSGAESAIPRAAINPSGDWTPYFPPGEWQKDMPANFETDACVSFSNMDGVETYGNYCIAKGLWPAEAVKFLHDNGYFNLDGKTLNFSDRFIARMSNTTTDGNSLPNVAQTAHDVGLVPESMWPFPMASIEANPSKAWQIYYADVSENVKAVGKQFLQHFSILYEWVKMPGWNPNIHAELAISPLQLATAVCWPWNTDQPINACGPGTAHATLLGKMETTGQYSILDHYVPFVKKFAAGYDLTYAVRIVIIPKAVIAPPPVFSYVFTKKLTYQDPLNDAVELRALQTALQKLKRPDGSAYLAAGVFGPFGPLTRTALDKFERDHHIVDPQPGKNFGPQNRAVMNEALKAN